MKAQTDSVLKQIADLQNLSYEELQRKWRELFGKQPVASNRPYLIKRLAHRLQEIAYGGLPEKAHKMMDDILDRHSYDENGGNIGQQRKVGKLKANAPLVGTRLLREWNGRTCEVTVIHGGFEYEGRRYRSLSAIATAITGTHWNGRAFFGVNKSHEKKCRCSV